MYSHYTEERREYLALFSSEPFLLFSLLTQAHTEQSHPIGIAVASSLITAFQHPDQIPVISVVEISEKIRMLSAILYKNVEE